MTPPPLPAPVREFGDGARLALLAPRNLHPVAVVTVTDVPDEGGPVGGPDPTPALLSVTRSVMLQDIYNKEEKKVKKTLFHNAT